MEDRPGRPIRAGELDGAERLAIDCDEGEVRHGRSVTNALGNCYARPRAVRTEVRVVTVVCLPMALVCSLCQEESR